MRHLHPARPLLTLAAACLMASPLASPQASSQTAPQTPPQTAPVTVLVTPAAVAPASTPEALAKELEGKTFFLRGFYQDEHLEFDTAGKPLHGLQKGSFALSGVEIDKVKFTKHSMEIQAHRVGLHFFGALPYEDDTKPFEKIKVDPKKSMNISIERLVIEPEKKKKKKELEKEKEAKALAAKNAAPAYKEAALATVPDAPEADTANASADTAAGESTPATTPTASTTTASTTGAPAPTIAPNHDPRVSFLELSKATNVIFAPGLDDSVISTLPAYWQNYFATKTGRARAAKVDASAMRPGGDVKPPQLLTMIDPASNDYAQKNNIAGMVFLQTVVDTHGHPGEVTIVRPIGFGLDEKAVEAVEHSQFRPGTLNGKAVPELVNLQVTFRIYSNRTRPNAVPQGAPTQVAPKESPKMPPSNAPVVAAATVSE